MGDPQTVEECDRELSDQRLILKGTISPVSKIAVWDQIDTLLERRLQLLREVNDTPEYSSGTSQSS